MFDASVKCPEGHTQPTKPISMRLARTRDGRPPLFSVSCPPTEVFLFEQKFDVAKKRVVIVKPHVPQPISPKA